MLFQYPPSTGLSIQRVALPTDEAPRKVKAFLWLVSKKVVLTWNNMHMGLIIVLYAKYHIQKTMYNLFLKS